MAPSIDPSSVGLLAVGDELLAGAHPDLNSPWLAHTLVESGRHVRRVVVVGDEEEDIASAVRSLAAENALVLVGGGLGPTLDDVTRHGVALAASVPLVHSEEAWAGIVAWFGRAKRPMPDANRRQALMPAGAEIVPNAVGTAPGFRLMLGPATVIVLPGPPRELQRVFELEIAPWLAQHPVGEVVHRVRRYHFSDIPESTFAEGVGAWMERDANPLMGVTVKGGVLSVRLLARGTSAAEADALLAVRGTELLERFGERLFSEHEPRLGRALGALLLEKGITVTVAESCTGGLVAGELTRTAGISAVFREAFITYSNEAKVRRLGVPEELLERHGAVSSETAAAMAVGAAAAAGARLAISVTGIAGPDGGSEEKPVGLVWFGLARDGAVRTVERRWPPAGRDKIRDWATTKALALLLEEVRQS